MNKLITPNRGLYLGCKRDSHDVRDFIFSSGTHLRLGGPAPSKVDVCDGLAMPEIFNQKTQGSCTANAGIRWRTWLGLKFPQYSPPAEQLSRQALYWWERNLPWNGDTGQDAGASSRDIFYVLANIGACPESDDPYSNSNLMKDPGPQAVTDAAPWKIRNYHRIPTVDEMKGCLLTGYSFTLGMTVYQSIEDVGENGIWNPDPTSEQPIGGHETFFRGFDDSVNGGSFYIDNSWGPGWGNQGSFYAPYRFFENYSASQWDAWTGGLGAGEVQ